MVDFDTRVRGCNKPSCLDLIITNNTELVNEIKETPPLGKSDHVVITFTTQCEIPKVKKKTIVCYDKGNYEQMKEECAKIP